MSLAPIYDGPALIRVAIPGVASGALQDLGYTEDGADVVRNPFWAEVKGDQNGGTEGPPIDIQWLGETATIRSARRPASRSSAKNSRRRARPPAPRNARPCGL